MRDEVSGEHPAFKESDKPRQDIAPDRAEAQRFLRYLAGEPDAVFNFRTVRGKRARNYRGTLAQCCDRLAARNAAGFDVYVIVNETNGGTTGADVVAVRAVFADFDKVLEGDTPDCRKQRLDYFKSIAPVSLAVETSPGRFHAYWFTYGMALERFTPFQKELAAVLGTDPVVCDLPRIMRVPGFVHQKEGSEPFLSRIHHMSEPKKRRKADFVSPDVLEQSRLLGKRGEIGRGIERARLSHTPMTCPETQTEMFSSS